MTCATDRRIAALLLIATLLVYGYFFQGYGFNQNAHFDTVRALVERATFEITPYAERLDQPGFTGDVSRVGERVYSSKPPGLALFVAPFYAVVYAAERVAGADPTAARMVPLNQHLCTIWGSALPGAVLAAALFCYFRQRSLARHEALLLAGGFAFGSLMFPYAGMLVTQTLMAACLFLAWRMIDHRPEEARADAESENGDRASDARVSDVRVSDARASRASEARASDADAGARDLDAAANGARMVLAGLLLGLTIVVEISAAPLVAAFALLAWRRRRRRRSLAFLLVGPALGVVTLLIYQRLVFGGALASSYSRVSADYLEPGLLFGHFHLPDLRRLYWLSVHPLRGLLYCCPIFFLAPLALLARRRVEAGSRPRHGWLIPAAVVVNFLLFNLTFHAWTAGWGVGPRYLVPAMPFLMIFAVAGYRRFPRIAVVLILISILSMFAVTAVRAQWPARLFGPPYGDDAVAESIKRLTMGQIARTEGSTNVGLLLGMPGAWSLIPPAAVIAALAVAIVRLRGSPQVPEALGRRRGLVNHL